MSGRNSRVGQGRQKEKNSKMKELIQGVLCMQSFGRTHVRSVRSSRSFNLEQRKVEHLVPTTTRSHKGVEITILQINFIWTAQQLKLASVRILLEFQTLNL